MRPSSAKPRVDSFSLAQGLLVLLFRRGDESMDTSGSRRQVILGALAATLAPGAARAQVPAAADPLRQLLGQALPAELKALLPAQAFQAAEFVSTLMTLEAEAKVARLPQSKLSPGEAPLPADLERLYELALPRLVALIDRAERIDPGLADKGGALLAKLHATQHVIPAWLTRPVLSVGATEPLRVDPGSDEAIGLPEGALPTLELPVPDIAAGPTAPITIRRSLRFADLAEEYTAMFKAAALRSQHSQSAQWHLTMMRQSRTRYEAAGRRTGVPWFVIGAIHGLEASFNFRAHFHNGDFPLTSRTRQVPAGRPAVWLPPSDWESSTADAMRLLGFAGASDWSLPRTLYRLEAFNGFGYRRLGRASPYLWSFSSLYERGKFVADGRFEAGARSQQCGTAVMLKLLADAGEISFG
jgi:lysozyme family protein